MDILKFKPQIAFWSSVPLILLYGFINNHGPFDTGTHDSPLIMSQMTFVAIWVIIFTVIGFGYLKNDKTYGGISNKKGLVHWIWSFGFFLAFWLYGAIKYRFDFDTSISTFIGNGRFDKINSSILVIMFIVQFLFLKNFRQGNVKIKLDN